MSAVWRANNLTCAPERSSDLKRYSPDIRLPTCELANSARTDRWIQIRRTSCSATQRLPRTRPSCARSDSSAWFPRHRRGSGRGSGRRLPPSRQDPPSGPSKWLQTTRARRSTLLATMRVAYDWRSPSRLPYPWPRPLPHLLLRLLPRLLLRPSGGRGHGCRVQSWTPFARTSKSTCQKNTRSRSARCSAWRCGSCAATCSLASG